MNKQKWSIISIVHAAIIFLLYLSPFWLSWKVIALLIILNYLQVLIFGGCILTIKQFGDTDISFQEWLWSQLGIKINRKKFNKFLMWQLPFILIAVAILWQLLLGHSVIIKI